LAAEVKLAAERERRAQDAARRRTEILRGLEEIETRRRALVETYGVAPETDLVSLHWLAERIGRWQDARRRETEAAAALEAVRSRFDAELAAAADRIVSLGCPRPADLETLAAAVEDLAPAPPPTPVRSERRARPTSACPRPRPTKKRSKKNS